MIAYTGLVIESLILLFVFVGLAMGRQKKVSNALGYTSIAWFVALIFVRYDHFGKVCSGEYLKDNEAILYPNMMKAAEMATLYVQFIWTFVFGLFLMVLIYSCCVDAKREVPKQEDEE